VNHGEIRCDSMDWIDLAQDRDKWRVPVNTVMKLWVPRNVAKFFSGSAIVGFSRESSSMEFC
jgi:hypothetical protein